MKVTVYSQPACLPCKRVIKKLEDAGIKPEIIDISEDQDAWGYVVNVLGAKSTPVLVASEGTKILGYQPEQLNRFIEAYKYYNSDIHDYVYEGDE